MSGKPFWTDWKLPALSWHVIPQSERCCVHARRTNWKNVNHSHCVYKRAFVCVYFKPCVVVLMALWVSVFTRFCISKEGYHVRLKIVLFFCLEISKCIYRSTTAKLCYLNNFVKWDLKYKYYLKSFKFCLHMRTLVGFCNYI